MMVLLGQENVGDALTAALTSTAAAQPDDPVEYMAHWLLKYLAVEEKKAKVCHVQYVGCFCSLALLCTHCRFKAGMTN